MTYVALATEDELSEAIGLRLLEEHASLNSFPPLLLRKRGFGYLRSRMDSWMQMAKHQVVLVLTDLDRANCPMELIEDWMGQRKERPPNFLLRVAVREIESWVLADHKAVRQLIGGRGKLPSAPDDLVDPKRYLLALARLAPKVVRDDMIAMEGAIASQGIGYNRRLVDWVQSTWCPKRAAERSPSLSRARLALAAVGR